MRMLPQVLTERQDAAMLLYLFGVLRGTHTKNPYRDDLV